jgi:hypothetical protein
MRRRRRILWLQVLYGKRRLRNARFFLKYQTKDYRKCKSDKSLYDKIYDVLQLYNYINDIFHFWP